MRKYVGTTLIELLLYIGIVSVFLLALSSAWWMLSSAKNRNQVIEDVNQQSQAIVNLLNKEIRGASTLTSPANGTTSATLSLDAGATQIYLQSGDLYLKKGANAAVKLNSNFVSVSDFVVLNATSNSPKTLVTIEIQLTYKNPDGSREKTYSQRYYETISFR